MLASPHAPNADSRSAPLRAVRPASAVRASSSLRYGPHAAPNSASTTNRSELCLIRPSYVFPTNQPCEVGLVGDPILNTPPADATRSIRVAVLNVDSADPAVADCCLNRANAVDGIVAVFKGHRGAVESLEDPTPYFRRFSRAAAAPPACGCRHLLLLCGVDPEQGLEGMDVHCEQPPSASGADSRVKP